MVPNTDAHGSAPHLPSGKRKPEEEEKAEKGAGMPERPQSEQGFGAPSPEERDVPMHNKKGTEQEPGEEQRKKGG